MKKKKTSISKPHKKTAKKFSPKKEMSSKKPKSKSYDHKKIEKKWQKEWGVKKVYETTSVSKAKKLKLKPMYILDMFPYPSGAGLHVGHPRGYIASDVYARMKRMQGYNVLHPMGFDSFGLPAEQYAISTGKHPGPFTDKLVNLYKKQLEIIGFSYDWSREVSTHKPEYYAWTQWIFLELYNSYYSRAGSKSGKAEPIEKLITIFEKKGNSGVVAVCDSDTPIFSAQEWKKMNPLEQQSMLMKYRLAYEGFAEVNWCKELGTVLANDEIIDGPNGEPVSERGGFPIEKRKMRQWFMRITAYADRLIDGLGTIDWSPHIKEIQRNWIGKSEGSEISFNVVSAGDVRDEKITVFTTRADTLFGVTYIVLAPEHELIANLKSRITNWGDVEKYIEIIKNKSEEDRLDAKKEKSGIELKGVKAINPANNEEVSVWIADYVLASYGTGAVMAVPAHDERDFEFAKKFNLPIKEVIIPYRIDLKNPPQEGVKTITRKTIHAIIYNPDTKNYLCLEWKQQPWTTFVVGGVEEGEDVVEAARREVFEETGYKNLRFIKILGGQVCSEYFAAHKNENRIADTTAILFNLMSEEQEPISSEEFQKHKIVWKNKDELTKQIMTCSELDIWMSRIEGKENAFTDYGRLNNSGKFNNLTSEEAKIKITEFVGGKLVTKYKMRDAIFARQRYWGEPIPLSTDKNGIIHEVKKLPLTLPNVKSYAPSGNGESPLSNVKDWVKNGYETNTMPGWAGSSWYFLRYMDPKNKTALAGKEAIEYWNNVDMYVGGSEHATGHLLYARFWHKFLKDIGVVSTEEPFKALRNQGLIMAADGRKMSKRWGNVINPDDIVATYGADTLRFYEMFMGPFDQSLPWSTESIIGSRRFIERVWRMGEKIARENNPKIKTQPEAEKVLHKTIKKVTEDISNFNFNTAVSSMMICINEMEKSEVVSSDDFKKFLKIISPFAPHVTEEIWSSLGEKQSIHISAWPDYDKKKIIDTSVKIAIQINSKVRAELEIPLSVTEEDLKDIVFKNEIVKQWVGDKEVKRFIHVKGKLVNILC